MKILLVHPHDIFDPHEPWTIRIESIAREFIRMGHEVKLIHFIHETSVEKLTMHPYGFEIISLIRRGGLGLFRYNFKEIIQEIKWADIVHFQKCFHYVSLPVICGCLVYSKPVHYDWDDFEEAIYLSSAHPPNWMVHFFLRTFERVLPRMVDTVSVSSDEIKNMCLSLGVPPDRIFDAPVGADLQTFGNHINGEQIRKRYNPPGKLVLYLGQLNGAQYTNLFIEAVSFLKKKSPDTRYLIIGSGSKFNQIKKLAHQLGVDDIIRFVGAIRHELVPQYLAAGDIAVACFEDNEITRCKSPLKVVEYLAAGKAIVASAVGEVKTMLNGCGVLVKPGSARSLAEGLLTLLDDGEKIQELSILARKRSEEKYNWYVVAQNLMHAYTVALGMNGYTPDVSMTHTSRETALQEAPQEEIVV